MPEPRKKTLRSKRGVLLLDFMRGFFGLESTSFFIIDLLSRQASAV